jgi:biotin transport system substrate-specific component
MKINTKDMILAALFAALTAVGAVILKIPVGPVPITLQFLFTALAGVMLGSKLGALSQLIYVVMGLFGLPVFAGGSGGPSTVFSPSFGYIVGFIVGAYLIGKIAEGDRNPTFGRLFLASAAGLIVIYAMGTPYLYIILNKVNKVDITMYGALKAGVLMFIPGDLVKCMLTALLGVRVIPTLKRQILR